MFSLEAATITHKAAGEGTARRRGPAHGGARWRRHGFPGIPGAAAVRCAARGWGPQGRRTAPRADAPRRARGDRRAGVRRHQDLRRRRAHRDEPRPGHLLLQDPRPAADRGDQVLRRHLVRGIPAADGEPPDRGRPAGRARRQRVPAGFRRGTAQLLADVAGPVGTVASESGGGRDPAEVRRAVAGGYPLRRAGRPGGRRVRAGQRGRLHDHAGGRARWAGGADRGRGPGDTADARVRAGDAVRSRAAGVRLEARGQASAQAQQVAFQHEGGAAVAGGSIELCGLTKKFSEVAVDNIDLTVASGEFFSLLGPSGCGKTTTLRLIAGFEQPTSGQILLDGVDVSDVPPHRRNVNTVFQSYALFPFLSVADNVAFGLRHRKLAKADLNRRVGEALELVRMSSFAKRRPGQLSGGQQQRVALARALVLNPAVLLLDEPLGALDAKLRRSLKVELKALQERVGITFLYVTHDQEEALTMSDRL